MKGVTSEVIAEVRSRASLLEVISEVVVLKRAGKEYRGLCPFHAEKTPSFHVNPEKGIYKCFGCGEGGDVFAFVQKAKGLEFVDTVRDLAHKYGVTLLETQEDKQLYDRRSSILMLYQQSAEYYARLLLHSEEGLLARHYLETRGVSDETIEKFKLGFAPNSWDGLLRFLTAGGKTSPSILEEAGLVRRRPDSTSYYDLFRNRLMIPICDDQGRVIAFGGRTMGDDHVKYLNSPESPIYTKGQHLFAFHLAKDHIKSQDAVIVVEGYFDAITAHQYGFTQTVATLGTALTDRQARLLVRYTESKRVFLSFDADAAGQKAVDRGVETLHQIAEGIGIELRVIKVPGGKDPDECLRAPEPSGGQQVFAQAIQSALLLIDYQLEREIAAVDLKTHTGRVEGARRIVPILGLIKNSVARGEYIRQWAHRLAVREEELLSDVGQFRRQKGMVENRYNSRLSADRSKKPPLQAGYLEAERNLLALCLSSRDEYEKVRAIFTDVTLLDPTHQSIKDAIEATGSKFNTVEDLHYRLMDRLAAEPEASRALVEIILKVEELRKQNVPTEVILKEGQARILQERLDREKRRLRLLLGNITEEGDQERLQITLNKLRQVESALLDGSKADDHLEAMKRKIDEVIKISEEVKQLEPKA